MPQTASIADLDSIVREIDVAAPPARVFEALVTPEQLLQWFGDETCKALLWEFDGRMGGRWRYESSDPTGKIAVNGVSNFEANGEIVEYDPPRKLAYTWIANWHDDPAAKTLVRWELSSAGKDTHVKVAHSGLTNLPVARKDYSGGWNGVLEQLKKHCE